MNILVCIKQVPDEGAVEYVEEEVKTIDKSQWKGIAVYVDHIDGVIKGKGVKGSGIRRARYWLC